MTADELAERLRASGVEVARHGREYRVACPTHEDPTPSVDFRDGTDRILVTCRAGCPTPPIVAAWGLTMPDLFHYSRNGGSADALAVYPYDDERGNPLYEVRRLPGKRFLAYLPGAERAGIGDTRRVPYRLPRIIDAARNGRLVFVVEGEKDVHAIERAGGIATCNPFGAGKWRPEYAEYLRGAYVIVVADRDEAGRDHARAVAASLVGIAADVTIVEARAGKDAADHLAAGYGLSELVEINLDDREPRPEPPSEPDREPRSLRGRLDASRVPLVARIREGIPPRSYLPGAHSVLARGKRYLVVATTKTGKSILALAIAVRIVLAGGRVVILDRENGADEYGRRLAAILDAWKVADDDRTAIDERLSYHAWPSLTLADRAEIASAMGAADLVVFDSSRTFLSALGLAENDGDDFASFMGALVDPLALAGATVAILDNTGHEDRTRARGTSSKADLADVVLLAEQTRPFDEDRTGALRLTRRWSRLDGIAEAVEVEIGGGVFGGLRPVGVDRHAEALRLAMQALDSGEVVSLRRLRDAIRAGGVSIRNETIGEWVAAWAADPTIDLEAVEGGYRKGAVPAKAVPGVGTPFRGFPGTGPEPRPPEPLDGMSGNNRSNPDFQIPPDWEPYQSSANRDDDEDDDWRQR